ncbi:MAG: spore coat protein [Clostridium sp.]|uniref:spore coat protein n=1 Tax=Clostridium sp. TaxID=1506 RepID=UPI002FC92EB3
MDDKKIMENLLLLTKGAADLYLHGSIESASANVRSAFNSALTDTLKMQADIYDAMAAKGWYPTEQVDAQQIDKVKQKYAGK